MICLRRLSIAGMALLVFAVSSFGDYTGITSGLENKCINGELWSFYVIYFNGKKIFENKSADLMQKCCNTGGSGQAVPGVMQNAPLKPLQNGGGNYCDSTNTQGGPSNTVNSQASVSSNGSPGGKSSARPAPRGRSGKPIPRAGGSTAFVRTVPFRLFPFQTFFNGANLPTITPQCNSQLNPSMLVLNHLIGTITRNNMCTGALIATIDVPTAPLQVRVTPDGSQAIVTSYYNAISFIDTDTNAISKTITTDGNTFPGGLVISPDGSFALVTNYYDVSPALLVLDVAQQQITRTIPLDQAYPQSVFLSPDGTLAWVTYPWGNTVEVIDLMTGIVSAQLNVSNPYAVIFNKTGTVAYIASGSPGSVVVVNTSTYRVTTTVPAGSGASDLSITDDDRVLTVNNYLDNSITVFDTIDFMATTYPVAGIPYGTVTVPQQ